MIRNLVRTAVSEESGRALAAISAGSFLLIGVQMIYPVLIPAMRESYGFSYTIAGLLLTSLWTANALGQLPGGMLADRIGEQSTLLIGIVVPALTIAVIVITRSIVGLVLATLLLGLGLSVYGVARYTAMDTLFPDQSGTSIGIVLAAADAGQTVLPPIASFLAVTLSWHFGFAFSIPLFFLVMLALWMFVPVTAAAQRPATDSHSLRGTIAYFRNTWRGAIGQGTGVFIGYVCIWVSFTSFYPTYLITIKNLTPTTAGVLFGAFFSIGILMKPLSGNLYDKYGTGAAITLITPLPAIALIALPFVDGLVHLAVLTLLIAPILGSGTISQSFLMESMLDGMKGTGLGLVRTVGLLLASVTPVGFGVLVDNGIFDEVFVLLGFSVLTLPLMTVKAYAR